MRAQQVLQGGCLQLGGCIGGTGEPSKVCNWDGEGGKSGCVPETPLRRETVLTNTRIPASGCDTPPLLRSPPPPSGGCPPHPRKPAATSSWARQVCTPPGASYRPMHPHTVQSDLYMLLSFYISGTTLYMFYSATCLLAAALSFLEIYPS